MYPIAEIDIAAVITQTIINRQVSMTKDKKINTLPAGRQVFFPALAACGLSALLWNK